MTDIEYKLMIEFSEVETKRYALEKQLCVYQNVLADLIRDSEELREKAFKGKVVSHNWRPLKQAKDLLGLE